MKTYKPTSPGRRGMTGYDFAELTPNKAPEKSLLEPAHSTRRTQQLRPHHLALQGRRPQAALSRHRLQARQDGRAGQGRFDRVRSEPHLPHRAAALRRRRQVVHPGARQARGRRDGDLGASSADIKPGNALPLRQIPLGTSIHNVELQIGAGGQLARSAGTSAQLMAKEGDWGTIRLPSGEMRLVHLSCRATIGAIGNADHGNVQWGKAGRMRWMGQRPHNRGVTMNPVDHPMGGGEGRSSGGRHPCSPWGMPTKGYKTRVNKTTDKFIVRRRGEKG